MPGAVTRASVTSVSSGVKVFETALPALLQPSILQRGYNQDSPNFKQAGFLMTSTNGNGNNDYTVPHPRAEWLARRKRENANGNFSQMHYARQGVITEEMSYIAHKEKLTPELVRDEVARGRM